MKKFHSSIHFLNAAQRLAAQSLGHFRFVVDILAGMLKSQFGVRSLSLGQLVSTRIGRFFSPFFERVILRYSNLTFIET
jgi:hypothetical protein